MKNIRIFLSESFHFLESSPEALQMSTIKHLNLAAANIGVYYEWTFWQIFDFLKKKSTVSGVAHCILCMP